MRTPIMAGNWKMHMRAPEAARLAADIAERVKGNLEAADVMVAPSFTSLPSVAAALAGHAIAVAAQDMHWADAGAFTGAVSPLQIGEFATHVILGHSERRHLFGESNGEVNRKAHAAFAHGLIPLICVGETEAQRDSGATDDVVCGQVIAGLEGLADDELPRTVLAYEPVWAIGTGRACDPEEAQRVSRRIRQTVDGLQARAGEAVRVLYGGSVNPDNVDAYVTRPDIDGALVGGASLSVESFARLVHAAARSA